MRRWEKAEDIHTYIYTFFCVRRLHRAAGPSQVHVEELLWRTDDEATEKSENEARENKADDEEKGDSEDEAENEAEDEAEDEAE